MGLNFYDYTGFQPVLTQDKHFYPKCMPPQLKLNRKKGGAHNEGNLLSI